MLQVANRMRGGPGRRQILFPLALSLPATPLHHSRSLAQATLSLEGYPGLHRDGLNDDSPAVAAALSDAMRNHQALYVPSGGPILLAGGARLPRLDDVALFGDGVQDGGPPPYGRRGSTFWITDDTESPFTLGRNWMVSKLNFFWPRQMERGQEPILYPPLFSNASGQPITTGVLEQLRVINAFDFFVADGPGPSETVGDVLIQGCRIYAVRDCFRLRIRQRSYKSQTFCSAMSLLVSRLANTERRRRAIRCESSLLREAASCTLSGMERQGALRGLPLDYLPATSSFTVMVAVFGQIAALYSRRLAETSFDGVATVRLLIPAEVWCRFTTTVAWSFVTVLVLRVARLRQHILFVIQLQIGLVGRYAA